MHGSFEETSPSKRSGRQGNKERKKDKEVRQTIELMILIAATVQAGAEIMLLKEIKLITRGQPLSKEETEELERQKRQLENMMSYRTGGETNDKNIGAGDL